MIVKTDSDFFRVKDAGQRLEKVTIQATNFNELMENTKREWMKIEKIIVYYFQQSSVNEEIDAKLKDRITLQLIYDNNSNSISFEELQEIQSGFPDFVLKETLKESSFHKIRLVKEIDRSNRLL